MQGEHVNHARLTRTAYKYSSSSLEIQQGNSLVRRVVLFHLVSHDQQGGSPPSTTELFARGPRTTDLKRNQLSSTIVQSIDPPRGIVPLSDHRRKVYILAPELHHFALQQYYSAHAACV